MPRESTSIMTTVFLSRCSHHCWSSVVFLGETLAYVCQLFPLNIAFSFQKAFKQIAATIKLCFVGLATFVVEFIIVFGSFCCFFYFVLSADLRNFYDPIHTVENTITMAIGKFNFASLRAANEMAAWIFFAFSSTILVYFHIWYKLLLSCCEHDPDQHDDGYNQHGIRRH